MLFWSGPRSNLCVGGDLNDTLKYHFTVRLLGGQSGPEHTLGQTEIDHWMRWKSLKENWNCDSDRLDVRRWFNVCGTLHLEPDAQPDPENSILTTIFNKINEDDGLRQRFQQ